jgi:2-polyprenyl-3-methyl-5-hydroxy-6-metoxy-1,4-benzoquinol methylase
MTTQSHNCPICQGQNIQTLLERQRVPTHQNLALKIETEATECVRGNLTISLCQDCGFVFNQSFDLDLLEYGEKYDNAQTYSQFFERYLDRLVHYLIHDRDVQNSRILEVGCGQGHFLHKLVADESANNYGYGCDPSYIKTEKVHPRLQFEQRYYGSDCQDIPVDVVICRHVIEHVPDPVGLLKSIRAALVNSPHARLFFETPCVEWILKNQVIWDFFYEHCSYFTQSSLTTAFQLAGFDVVEVKHIFGGQYLWLEAKLSQTPVTKIDRQDAFIQLSDNFIQVEQQLLEEFKTKIHELSKRGNVALWGAGAKGATLANLLDPNRQIIKAVIDLNPNKHGCYISGTGHPIISYPEVEQYKIKSALLMNPNYYQENLDLIDRANLDLILTK